MNEKIQPTNTAFKYIKTLQLRQEAKRRFIWPNTKNVTSRVLKPHGKYLSGLWTIWY